MSVELNVATTDYLGERYTFLDCPGSIEFNQDIGAALVGCDVAVVVCEADEKKFRPCNSFLSGLMKSAWRALFSSTRSIIRARRPYGA